MERLTRTSYRDPSTGTDRDGDTAHRESSLDLDRYTRPLERIHNTALHRPGVATGLQVHATLNTAGLLVTPGVAIDPAGNHLSLAEDGLAKTGPNTLTPVTADGATIPTDGLDGPFTLTISYAETFDRRTFTESERKIFQTDHTPWLQLRPPEGIDPTTDVILADLTLTEGAVTTLAPGNRLGTPTHTDHLHIHQPPTPTTGTTLTIGADTPTAAELLAPLGGGLELRLPAPGDLTITADNLTLLDQDGRTAFSVSADTASLFLPFSGSQLGIGVNQAQRPLHVEGKEIHSGGSGAGLSFADRTEGGFTDLPSAGERWVWYAQDGVARLWSGADVLSIGHTGNGDALDVRRRIRLRQGGDASAGMWLFQTQPGSDRAFVGMAGDDQVGFWGNTGAGWGLTMDTSSGAVGLGIAANPPRRTLHVEGSEIHSGGGGGGFSFADRSKGGFTDLPGAGERWVWYAVDGVARLWSNGDVLSIGLAGNGDALDVSRRMRVRDGRDSAGIWLFQGGADQAFVGLLDSGHVGFFGAGTGWGMQMNTNSGNTAIGNTPFNNVKLRVDGKGGTAAYFEGDVRVTGKVSKAAVQFVIDHPMDPENRYLCHNAVESDEMKNFYDGEAELDAHGRCEVPVPDWFESLNERVRYQLTALDGPAPALHIATRLLDGHFTIAGGEPRARVCWQLTGVRRDAYALANPLVVEPAKPAGERGAYLHPRAHGLPAERGIGWAG